MRVWIDLANSPHVLLFRPMVTEMIARGHDVRLTMRDFAQTVPLARQLSLAGDTIGDHGGRGAMRKVRNIAMRARELRSWAKQWLPDIAVSHNSYAQVLAAKSMGIPVVTMMDYEGQPANRAAFRLADRVIVPEAFPVGERLRQGATPRKTKAYSGLKEQMYLWDARPDARFRERMGLDAAKTLVVLRPPATMALYHDFENPLFDRAVEMLSGERKVQTILLPRSPEQEAAIRRGLPSNFIVPSVPLEAVSLLRAADLMIGAGGTMNREAAVLGTPAYSIFAGRPAAVDEWLCRRGLMKSVKDVAEVVSIPLRRKLDRNVLLFVRGRELMTQVVDWCLEVAHEEQVAATMPVAGLDASGWANQAIGDEVMGDHRDVA